MIALLREKRSGELATYDVPAPELRPGGILVKTQCSAISTGTEQADLDRDSQSIIAKAMAHPGQVGELTEYAWQNGIHAAYDKLRSKLSDLTTFGYSCSGVVIAVGEGVSEFCVGERVACGGSSATHSEINFVPRNLAVHIPAQVPMPEASLTTIGAIAMQAVRQANLTIGECLAVIGTGLVGVLTMQIARAAGCRIVAIDVSEQRVQAATQLGADLAVVPEDPTLLESVRAFSPHGVDAAIVTAATPSSEPLEIAAKLLRDRGRIVVVGCVGMDVSRRNMYAKELTLALSRSYGPGRYDRRYEEHGIDYPIGYVRWTERRNMESFLDLIASKRIDVGRLVEHRYPIDRASQAYANLKGGIYTAILEYDKQSANVPPVARYDVHLRRPPVEGVLRIGCIGAGSFARTIIPQLKSFDNVQLESVATISGTGAASAQRAFRFAYAQQPSELLENDDVDAVFILTRHDTHATYATAALRSGKSVFIEKPLAASHEQLTGLTEEYRRLKAAGGAPFVMAGFNRRFAPLTLETHKFFDTRQEPLVVHARINAGYISPDHWVHESGGRIVGELCHFVDWARALVGFPIMTVAASGIPDSRRYRSDNAIVTIKFADGSVANLVYVANGDRSIPKEFFEVFCEGRIARLHDFGFLELASGGKIRTVKSRNDKGHRRELQLTVEAMRSGAASPISFEELAEVSQTTFCIKQALATGDVIRLADLSALEPALTTGNTALA